jgi:hypothetical protein
MRNVSVVCPVCKELTPVIDKKLQQHSSCPASGMRYIPSPRYGTSDPMFTGAPKIELLKQGSISIDDGNRIDYSLSRITLPDPTSGTVN